ncbi:unnamed protein product [Pleuronectes platessa]|uniref:Uncharacterized protein n=1 Tax=Pleuronectes platessa TaxID=8262 RepID=A0A9N7USF2_PLEPL|nr:unnamed protein product [Pleuronectes platessa]
MTLYWPRLDYLDTAHCTSGSGGGSSSGSVLLPSLPPKTRASQQLGSNKGFSVTELQIKHQRRKTKGLRKRYRASTAHKQQLKGYSSTSTSTSTTCSLTIDGCSPHTSYLLLVKETANGQWPLQLTNQWSD